MNSHPLKPVAMAASALLLAACSQGNGSHDNNVKIAVDVPYQPMEYQKPDGSLTGFDIDLGNALCKKAQLHCQWQVQAWDGIIPGLMARKYDAIMSSMTINDQRRQQLLFTTPYLKPPSAWFAPVTEQITEANAQTLKGKTIGVQRGTLQDNYVTDLYGKDAHIRRYETADDLRVDMNAGRLDLAFLDFPNGKTTMLDDGKGKYKIVGEMIDQPRKYFGDGFGIGLRKGDQELADKLDKALDEARQDGSYQQIYDRYFKVDSHANG